MEWNIACGNARATVASTGGELIRFEKGGTDYAWRGSPDFWSGHAPVLFPTVGALNGNETEIDGKTYPMKKHGFARKCEFEPSDITDNSALFLLSENEQTLASFPFPFELWVKHTVLADGFSTQYRVENTGRTPMPFGIGGHQGFCCPIFEGTAFSDYSVLFEKREDGPAYTTRLDDCGGIIHREDRVPALEGITKLDLAYPLFDKDVVLYTNLQSRVMKLVHRQSGHGVEFSVNGFSSLGIWSPPAKQAPFVCLEPWTVTPDFADASKKFEEKPGITMLAPGAEFTAGYRVKII